jgi:hypothetical protein
MSDDTTSVIVLMTLFEACVPENHIFSGQEPGSPYWKSCGKGPPERAAVWTVRFAIPGRNKIFFFSANVEGSAQPPGVKLSIDLHLVLRLRMSGAVFLPHFAF